MAEPTWPHSGQRVDVELPDAATALIAVVDDVRPPDQLHLRIPVQRDGSPSPALPLGSPLELRWTSPAGQHVLPSTLVGMPEARVELWKLEPAEDPQVVQRRDYVRVPETLKVTLRRSEDVWVAGLCDLSEGGARCVILSANDLAEDDALLLCLSLESRELELPAAVVGVQQGEDRTTVRVRFPDLGRQSDLLRRRVLEQQRRARAAGLR